MSSSRPSRPSQPSQPSRPSRPSHPSNTSRSSQSSQPLAPVAQDTNIPSEPSSRVANQKPLSGPGNAVGRAFEPSGREENKENVEEYAKTSRRSQPSRQPRPSRPSQPSQASRPSQPSRPSRPSRSSHPTSEPARKEIKAKSSFRASTHSTGFAIYTPPTQPTPSSDSRTRRALLHTQLSELRVDDTPPIPPTASTGPGFPSVMGPMSEVAKRENKENIPPGTVFLDDDDGLGQGGHKGKKAGKAKERTKGKGERL